MTEEMTPDELLAMAQGVGVPTEEMVMQNHKLKWTKNDGSVKERNRKRRGIRKTLFKIARLQVHGLPMPDKPTQALFEIINEQLEPNLNIKWTTFSHTWDVAPNEPTKVIRKEEWQKHGGGFDPEFGAHSPTAFTNQEID